jgi:hypothetical protein
VARRRPIPAAARRHDFGLSIIAVSRFPIDPPSTLEARSAPQPEESHAMDFEDEAAEIEQTTNPGETKMPRPRFKPSA